MPPTFSSPTLNEIAPSALELDISDISVGYEVAFSWFVKEHDIDTFAKLSGDFNPLHMDNHYAKSQGFESRVVHGFLIGAKVSGLVGMLLPGRRCLLLEENLAFPNPVYAGSEIVFTATVKNRHEDLGLIVLKIIALCDTKTVLRGKITCKFLP